MYKVNIKPIILSLSTLIVSGLMTHGTQMDSMPVMSTETMDQVITRRAQQRLDDIKVDNIVRTISLSGHDANLDTSARPRETDENDQKANKRSVDDSFNNNNRLLNTT